MIRLQPCSGSLTLLASRCEVVLRQIELPSFSHALLWALRFRSHCCGSGARRVPGKLPTCNKPAIRCHPCTP
eukprot:1156165-Amphidinium_carterae.1